MTITTTANAHKGTESYSPVKLPDADLQLPALSESDEVIGTLTVKRSEDDDQTTFIMETAGRGRAVREWLNVDGLNKADIPKRKKQSEKHTDKRAQICNFCREDVPLTFSIQRTAANIET